MTQRESNAAEARFLGLEWKRASAIYTEETRMSAMGQSDGREPSLLQLGEELGDVSKAVGVMGFSGGSFYEIKRPLQTGGAGARRPTKSSASDYTDAVD